MIDETKKQEIMDELRREEGVEGDMIDLYRTLIEQGAVNCLPADKQEEFARGVEILHRESEMHQRLIKKLIEKYDDKQ